MCSIMGIMTTEGDVVVSAGQQPRSLEDQNAGGAKAVRHHF